MWCGRDEIDVFRADILQFEHGLSQGFRRKNLAYLSGLQYLVLTKHTTQVASGEKHRTGTARSADARFFIPMQAYPSDSHGIVTAAKAALRVPVYVAKTRTKIATHGRLPQTKLRSQYD